MMTQMSHDITQHLIFPGICSDCMDGSDNSLVKVNHRPVYVSLNFHVGYEGCVPSAYTRDPFPKTVTCTNQCSPLVDDGVVQCPPDEGM